MLFAIAITTSCKKKKEEEVNYADKVVGVFKGEFNKGNFSSLDYTITVTDAKHNKIKVTPEDSNGTEFSVEVKEVSGVIISLDNSLNMSNTTGIDHLQFDRDGETFNGYRQN